MSTNRIPHLQMAGCVLAAAALALLVWYGIARPREVKAEWQGPLKSASFAPFREGQSPLKEIFPTAQQIEEDLVRLKGVFSGVRTYTSLGGMEVVPALAAKHGFELTHSAWLGREEEPKGKLRNEEEIAALIDTANRYPDAVKRVLVGNEVLLRRDLKPDELIAYIDRVRGAIRQPVSYADVWAFWLKHPQVADHVDYITIHILPYWEDEPVALDEAQQHMLAIIDRIKQRFPGKPILVGETGWPTEGRSRGPAHADLLTAAHFVRDLPRLAEEHGFDYNLVEAYDQGWKAQLEGTVGARWGMFDESRTLKFGLTGPVVPLDNAMPRIAMSVMLGVLVSLLLVPLVRSAAMVLGVALWSQLFAAMLVLAVYKAIRLTVAPASFTWAQQNILFSLADKHWIGDTTVAFWYKLLLQQMAVPLAHAWGWLLAVFSLGFALAMLGWLRKLLQVQPVGRVAVLARGGFGAYAIGALVFAGMFATSGRYIDIPLPLFWLPLVAALALVGLRHLQAGHAIADTMVVTRCPVLNRHALWLLPLAALACVWGEVGAMLGGEDFITMHPTLAEQLPLIVASILANHQLLLWCAACVLLGLVFARQPASAGR